MFCFTHLSDFLDGKGEDVEDDHPLLRRWPVRQFHQNHVCVQHQVAQVKELNPEDTECCEVTIFKTQTKLQSIAFSNMFIICPGHPCKRD